MHKKLLVGSIYFRTDLESQPYPAQCLGRWKEAWERDKLTKACGTLWGNISAFTVNIYLPATIGNQLFQYNLRKSSNPTYALIRYCLPISRGWLMHTKAQISVSIGPIISIALVNQLFYCYILCWAYFALGLCPTLSVRYVAKVIIAPKCGITSINSRELHPQDLFATSTALTVGCALSIWTSVYEY